MNLMNSTLVGAIIALTSSPLLASWAYVPQEVRIAEADLVVAGEVQKYGEDVKKNGQVYQVGIIKPIELLKGKPKMAGDIRLAWPKRVAGGLRLSTDLPAPRVGDKSIWVMSADDKLPVYWATYPTDRQPLEKLAEMKKKLAAVKAIQWSKSENGVQIGMVYEQRDLRKSKVRVKGKPVKAVAQISVYALLKNTGDAPMHASNYIYKHPFMIELLGPDGRAIDVATFTPPAKIPAPRIHDFVEIQPGKIRNMGYGFQLPMLTKGGEYSIRVTHKNSLDPKALKLANVWTGELKSPTLKVNVPE